MKKLAAILCLSALTTGAFAQGLVNFFNNANALISVTLNGSTSTMSGAAGSYYFALLTAAAGTTDPTKFTLGAYATNQAVAGRFFGGAGVAVPGWGAGTSNAIIVAGWSAGLGATFQSSWLAPGYKAPGGNVFGMTSPLTTGPAGGATASGTFPNFNIFGGTSGLANGFSMVGGGGIVPEPSSLALAGLGGAALLMFRRRK